MSRRRMLLALAGLLAANTGFAQADKFPSKPLRIVVPFNPGSGADGTSRYFAEKLGPILGQQVIVENKPGGDGSIGMSLAKAAPADGYTIVMGSISASSVNAVLKKDLPYDPVNDFKPVYGYQRNMNVLLVPVGSRLQTMGDLVTAAKSATTPLNVATFSTAQHLSAAWIGTLAGVKFTNIPYKGQAQIITELIGNQTDFALVELGGASTMIRTGKVRAIAVTGEKRHPDFPDIPTVRETAGLEPYAQYAWNAFYIRREVPPPVHARLADAVQRILTSEEVLETFYKPKGAQAVAVPSDQVRAMQLGEIEAFRKVANAIGMQAE